MLGSLVFPHIRFRLKYFIKAGREIKRRQTDSCGENEKSKGNQIKFVYVCVIDYDWIQLWVLVNKIMLSLK